MPQISEDFSRCLEKRIRVMSRVSTLLMALILIMSLGFVAGVLAFEFSFASRPDITNSLRNAAWDAKKTILDSESNLKSIIANPENSGVLKTTAVAANLEASTRAIEAFTAKVEHLAKVAAAEDDGVVSAFINSKRLLIALAGLFLAVIIKLLIELYKYNAHLRSHYLAVGDALLLEGGKFNAANLDRVVRTLSPPNIRIGPVRSLHEAVVETVDKSRGSES